MLVMLVSGLLVGFVMSEKPEYDTIPIVYGKNEVQVTQQSAFDGQFVYLWIEKLWPSVTLKSRGSQMNHGYTLFPRGQLVVKFEVSPHIVGVNRTASNRFNNGEAIPHTRGGEPKQRPTDSITVEQLANLLEQTIEALAPSYKTFVTIEDSQDNIRNVKQKEGDF